MYLAYMINGLFINGKQMKVYCVLSLKCNHR